MDKFLIFFILVIEENRMKEEISQLGISTTFNLCEEMIFPLHKGIFFPEGSGKNDGLTGINGTFPQTFV